MGKKITDREKYKIRIWEFVLCLKKYTIKYCYLNSIKRFIIIIIIIVIIVCFKHFIAIKVVTGLTRKQISR